MDCHVCGLFQIAPWGLSVGRHIALLRANVGEIAPTSHTTIIKTPVHASDAHLTGFARTGSIFKDASQPLQGETVTTSKAVYLTPPKKPWIILT